MTLTVSHLAIAHLYVKRVHNGCVSTNQQSDAQRCSHSHVTT